ncbi:ATP-dependent nuclease [Collimonas silvisoli]|uniref:ATP-dependent nuclease n=1 Tax=Collimonas silvisoli TaxID=2825884 RepID=UPI001B8BFCBB|nr:AAA family ATPase [Collimonas silvisoli]
MHVSSIHIKGFRCFDDAGQRILLNDFTCFIGPNASGKTASMLALARLFADTQAERTIRSSDFHLRPGEQLSQADERHLSIEVKLEFPGIAVGVAADAAIPETFNQMVVAEPGGSLYCRIRLEAIWTKDGTALGDVQQKLLWILTPSDDPEIIKNNQRSVKTAERARLRVIYVPAARDPAAQIRTSSATIFGRLLKAIDWGEHQMIIQERLQELKEGLGQLTGLETMNAQIQRSWESLYEGRVAANVSFQSEQADASSLLGMLVPTFAPNEQGQAIQAAELSDGLRSLFALSLPLGFYRIEEQLKQAAEKAGFRADVANSLPLLTIFAVEEPENHLSPHYLGKVVTELNKIANDPNAQVVLSSHSPSIMRRVEPDDVRYYLGGESHVSTTISALNLPEIKTDEAFKYVREAIRGYPELYFSRLVVLGEGASEEIILRKVFEASGTPVDSLFVSVVPLGGRHVNHFWKLLHGLKIPFVTLLDLDREKQGAGWGRLRYIRDQLVALHGGVSPILEYQVDGGTTANLANVSDEMLGGDDQDSVKMKPWIDYYQRSFSVFFAKPLDIDFSMLKCFPNIYQGQAPANGGPRLPADEPLLTQARVARMHQVLAADATAVPANLGQSYDNSTEVPLFAWYKYLFLDGSKPVSHMRAMIALEGSQWVESMPTELKELVACVKAKTAPVPPPPPPLLQNIENAAN